MKTKPKYPNINRTLGSICSAVMLSATAVLADTSWIAGTDTWNNTANWNNGLPSAGPQNAIVNNGGTVLIQAGDPTFLTFDIRAGDGSGTGHYRQTGGAVQCNSWFRIGIGGGTGDYLMTNGTLSTARFIISDNAGPTVSSFTATNSGTITVPGDEVWIGQFDNGNGVVNLGGNVSFTANNWFALSRDNGIGVLNISNNAVLNKLGANAFTIASVLHNPGVTPTGTGTINQGGFATINVPSVDTWLPEDNIGIWNMSGSCTSIVATLQFGHNLGNNGGLGQGTLNLNGGNLIANQITKGAGTGTLNFNGGTLRPRGANANFMSGVVGALQTGGAVIDTAGFNIGISSTISDGSPAGNLTKVGNGTLTMSASTYTGNTIISAGKLVEISGVSDAGGVNIASGAGYGVTVATANAQVTHSSITITGPTSSLNFDLGGFGNPTTAPLGLTGNIAVNGTVTVNIADANPSVQNLIPLMTYTTRSGSGNFALGTLPAGVSATLTDDTVNKTLWLNISSTALIRWNGNVVGGIWDLNTTANWTDYLTAAAKNFTTGAAVFFDDLATGTTTSTLNVSVAPGSITVTNDGFPYVITGSGAITGATSLTKQGTNSLTLTTTNTYTGVTTISGGTVSINKLGNGGSASGIGAASSSPANLVLNGGTLSYTGPATSTDRGLTLSAGSTLDVQGDIAYNGSIAPALGATLTKTGQGTLSITNSGVHPLSAGGGGGAFTISGGTVLLDGSATGGQTNNVSGEVWVGGSNATNSTLIVTNSTLNMSSWLAVARGSGTGGATSSVSLYNSKMTSGNMSLGFDGGISGSLQYVNLSLSGNSTFTNNGVGNLCESSGSTSTISLKDSSVFYSSAQVYLGQNPASSGTLTVANTAKVVVNSWFSVGSGGSTATATFKDNTSLTCGDFNICDVNAGIANFYAQDNANIHGGNIWVGKGNGSIGYLLISNNATVLSDNGLTLGQGVTSLATVDLAGNSTLSVNLLQGTPSATSLSTFNFNGGTLIAHPPYFGSNFIFSLEACNVQRGGAKIEIDGTDVRNVSQSLLDGDGLGGGLTKTGNGTLLLDGANTYTGNTVISAGTLGGSGSVAGNVSVPIATTLAPGDGGIGTFTIGNNLALNGTLAIYVNETNAAPNTNSLVAVSGSVTGSGAVKVINQGPALSIGDRFVIFSHSVTGLSVPSSSGVTWNNNLAIDGSISVAAMVAPPSFATVNPVTAAPGSSTIIHATGVVGNSYTLYATSNLTLPMSAWTVVSTGTVPSSSFSITDAAASGITQRFYRFANQ